MICKIINQVMLIFQRAIGQWFAWKNPLQSDPFYPFIF